MNQQPILQQAQAQAAQAGYNCLVYQFGIGPYLDLVAFILPTAGNQGVPQFQTVDARAIAAFGPKVEPPKT